jgi:dihydroneopterin aldolase
MSNAAAFNIVPDAGLPGQSYVRIVLERMEINVRIGLHAHEQKDGRSQRVFVSIELFAALGDYLKDATRESIIDYDHIYKAVKSWGERPHTYLIETYLSELAQICFADKRIEACRIAVFKPDIFPEVEKAGVEVFIRREDHQP